MLQNVCFNFPTHVEAIGLSVRIPAHKPVIGNCVVQGVENRPSSWEQENSCALSSLCHLRTQWEGRHLQAKPPKSQDGTWYHTLLSRTAEENACCLRHPICDICNGSWGWLRLLYPSSTWNLSDFRVQGNGSSFQMHIIAFSFAVGNAGAPLLHDYSLLARGI